MDKSYNARRLRDFMKSRGVSFELAARAFDLAGARGCSHDLALGIAVQEQKDRGAAVRTEPYMPTAADIEARRRINDARGKECREIEKEAGKTEKPTSSGKARNPFAKLTGQRRRQELALHSLFITKPATATVAEPTAANSKTVSVGRVVIAGSIAEKIGGANR